MAIDNIFLGLGRKSVGDVTLYRRAGKQCARVRVRNVRNPRSYKQLFTRAILSNVAQLYATGIEIFNHAFEGRSTGMDCQKRFMKLNVDRLRALMTADYNASSEPSLCKARIGARNLKVAVPFEGLQVSEGNYQQLAFTYGAVTSAFALPSIDEPLTVAEYASRAGLLANDIYTFVAFNINPAGDYVANYGPDEPVDRRMCIYPCSMSYAQLKVRADIASDLSIISSSDTYTKLFDFYGGEDISDEVLSNPVSSAFIFGELRDGGIACIRSKWGTDLRSTSFLQPSKSTPWEYGLTYHLLEAAWGNQSGINRADLILDGENFGPSQQSTNPAAYIGTVIPILTPTTIVDVIKSMPGSERFTLLFNGYVLVGRYDGIGEVTFDFVDPLGVNKPSLVYDSEVSQTSRTLTAYRNEQIESGWIDDLTAYFVEANLDVAIGEAVTTFGRPSLYVDQ